MTHRFLSPLNNKKDIEVSADCLLLFPTFLSGFLLKHSAIGHSVCHILYDYMSGQHLSFLPRVISSSTLLLTSLTVIFTRVLNLPLIILYIVSRSMA